MFRYKCTIFKEHNISRYNPLVKNLHFVLPEDGTRALKHVGDMSYIYIYVYIYI
jgi:hypothetical protein